MKESRNVINPAGVFLILFLICGHVYASAAPVRMLDETVTIRIGENHTANVSVIFNFSDAENYSADLVFPETDWFPLKKFAAIWNDKKLTIRKILPAGGGHFEIAGENYPSLFRFHAPMANKVIAKHEISYQFSMPLLNDQKYALAHGWYGEYILKTGAPWHGTIGRITVNIELADCSRLQVIYGGYEGKCIHKKLWRFNAVNIEPSRDIRFVITEQPEFSIHEPQPAAQDNDRATPLPR